MNRLVRPGRLTRRLQRSIVTPIATRPSQWRAFATSQSNGGLQYEVTDADIQTLARKHQHPLSLADLVKYLFLAFSGLCLSLKLIRKQTRPPSPLREVPPLLGQLHPLVTPHPPRPPPPSPPQPPLHRRLEPQHLAHLPHLPALAVHPAPVHARRRGGPTHKHDRG